MRWTSAKVASLVLVLAAFAVTAMVWPRLPAIVPIHWNATGQADGFAPRSVGVWFLPSTLVFVFLVFEVIARVAPREAPIEPFLETFEKIRLLILAFLFYVMTLTLLAGMGAGVDMTRSIFGGLGVLFAGLGHCLATVTPNHFVGIRTPWTLADPEVWRRTHQVGGRSFMIAGLVILGAAFVPGALPSWTIAGAGLAIAVLVPVVYSFVSYRATRPPA